MRRLAKQSRNDSVLSARDYQTIQDRQGVGFRLDARRPCRMVFNSRVRGHGNTGFVGAGIYVRADANATLRVQLVTPSGAELVTEFACTTKWTGFGMAALARRTGIARLQIDVPRGVQELQMWGLDCGAVSLPDGALGQFAVEVDPLNSAHLTPETLYLPQSEAIGMDVAENEWVGARVSPKSGALIQVKKCAYCQRHLPIDKRRPSALAFHKHNAKVSGHQNECRACKKWRINDTFNPKRTVDQLHESSVITRERQLFLRDPEILARIKDRTGDGLKSIIWKRFRKKCFNCKKPLELEEVELDHTRPMAYLWPIDEHATCLCAECNGHKREQFPVDVYTAGQLKELSKVTGLALDVLRRKEINHRELKRVLRDIETYAREWDPRTFNATARKIRELRPDVDLFEVLRKANSRIHSQLLSRLAERPDSV